MHDKLKQLTCIAICLFVVTTAFGQKRYFDIGIFGGLSDYQGEFTDDFSQVSELADISFGMNVKYHLNPKLAVRFQFAQSSIRGADSLFMRTSPTGFDSVLSQPFDNFQNTLLQFGFQAEYHFRSFDPGSKGLALFPYAHGGVSVMFSNPEYTGSTSGTSVNINNGAEAVLSLPVGLGVKWRIAPFWYISTEAGVHITTSDMLDGVEPGLTPMGSPPATSGNDFLGYFHIGINHVINSFSSGIPCPVID